MSVVAVVMVGSAVVVRPSFSPVGGSSLVRLAPGRLDCHAGVTGGVGCHSRGLGGLLLGWHSTSLSTSMFDIPMDGTLLEQEIVLRQQLRREFLLRSIIKLGDEA